MRNTLIIVLIFISSSACNIDSKFFPKKAFAEDEKILTFIQYHVSDKEGVVEDYYYFGLISKDLYRKIKTHEVNEGLIFMEKVKYWNTDDVIESYADEIYSDEMAFRIEDIVRLDLVKEEPVDGFQYPEEEQDAEAEAPQEI
ncbi:MAG: hypothetical protein HND53_12250 [Proteobacteria bacterium]|nr:hypothetical protein [Pseudomonadota bacterium]NOG61265.1 hypothetical protein [Pseudomonadota bacterium]